MWTWPDKEDSFREKKRRATRPPPSNVNNVGNIDSIDENLVSLGGGIFQETIFATFRNVDGGDDDDDDEPDLWTSRKNERWRC